MTKTMTKRSAGSRGTLAAICALSAVLTTAVAEPDGKATAAQPDALAVLGGKTLFRTFHVFRTPVVVKADGTFTPAFVPRGGGKQSKIGDYHSPLPDSSWRSAEFDDLEWARSGLPIEKDKGYASGRNPGALHTATPDSVICSRTKFVVDDPAAVGDLTLDLKYVGGVAVFLNGQEVLRQHLPAGELTPDTLAERYPDDLYVLPEKRFEKRGWWDVSALGHQSYAGNPGAQILIGKRIWPDAAWNYSSHCGTLGGKWGGMPILYSECVWTAGQAKPRGYERLLAPGRDKSIWNYSFRDGHGDNSSLATLLRIPEEAIIYLQRALDAKQVSGELAKRVNACLDARGRSLLSGWDDHNGLWAEDRELFALAAEVEAAGRE